MRNKISMPANGKTHRFNHYIPCFMLRYWEQKIGNKFGVHVFLINENRFAFERSRGRRPFRFAAVEDLYVPIIEGCRVKSMEEGWLNGFETALAHFVGLACRREPLATSSQRLITNFGMGLFALEQRSRYNLVTLKKAIEENDTLRALISATPRRETWRIVLENLIHIVTELYKRCAPLELTFLHSKDESFIITDRPYFWEFSMEYHFIVLTNKLAVLCRQGHIQPKYNERDVTADFVNRMNKIIVVRARDWIVADNLDQLKRYAKLYCSEDAEKDRTTDRLIGIEPMALRSGWSFRSPKKI